MKNLRCAAVIPAAGLSSRMEGFKPLLKIGEKTLIEHAIARLESAGVDEIVIVLGHRAEELIPVVETTSARWLLNPCYLDDMFTSIQCGVSAYRNANNAFFVLPVDTPLVHPATVVRLQKIFRRDCATICYPTYNGRRGHPPLIDTSLTQEILAYNGTGGLRGLLRRFEKQARNVEVEDPFVTMDADTPADLARLRMAYSQARKPA